MTTDTTALQERVAEELYYEQYPEGRHRNEWPAAVYPDIVYEYRDLAAAVLPIIAAEVQAAKAEALREAAEDLFYDGDQDVPIEGNALLHSRADEYETGDRA